MSYIKLGQTLRLPITTHDATGQLVNADSTPTVVCYEDGTVMAYSATVISKGTGRYEAAVVASTGNGFEVGKDYSVFVQAIVNAITGEQGLASFQVTTLSPEDNTVRDEIRRGTAQAGAVSSITLDAGASATSSIYNGLEVTIISGTGAGQTRRIRAYVGASKVASVTPGWWVTPDATSVFVLRPGTMGAEDDAFIDTSFATGCITSTKFAASAISAAAIATDAIGSAQLAASAVTEIQSGLATSAALATVQADTDDIQTRLPAALTAGGKIKASTDEWNATAVATPTTAGVPRVDVKAMEANVVTAAAVADGAIDFAALAADATAAIGIVRRNTATAGGASTITLDAGASAVDSFYKNTLIAIVAGTGVGQVRGYSSYVGATKVYTVDTAWSTTPDNTSVFSLIGNVGGSIVGAVDANVVSVAANAITAAAIQDAAIDRATFAQDALDLFAERRRNTAAAGGASTITLDAGASAVDDFYKNGVLVVVSGTGVGQFRTISSYVGSTKVATVDRAWSTTPDATSVFELFAAGGSVDAATVASAVWNAVRASYATAGTFGEGVNVMTIVSAAANTVRDAILNYAHDTGVTIKGAFRRMDAFTSGKATGMKGAIARFFMRDGSTAAIRATQDVSAGTRTAADVTGSEA